MTVYWIMFLVPLIGVFARWKMGDDLRFFINVCFFLFFTIIIGLRYKVGGDWDHYLYLYDTWEGYKFNPLKLIGSDYLYVQLNIFARNNDLGIGFVNLMCAMILVLGVLAFCNQQKDFFLALLISVPYVLVVVGMGYTRQSAALGFSLLALTVLTRGKFFQFLVFIYLGMLFHKSCLILLPFAVLSMRGSGNFRLVLGFSFAFLAFVAISLDSILGVINHYLKPGDMQSSGALVRILLSALPALFVLKYSETLLVNNRIKNFWFYFSFLPLFAIPLSFVVSTLADRLLLYSIPLQILVFSSLSELFEDPTNKNIVRLSVVILYFTSFFVWLNFAFHRTFWLPYSSFLVSQN